MSGTNSANDLFDADAIDQVFRLVNREVWIVTAANQSRRGGLVATWVSQASLDPNRPIVMAALAPTHFTAELIADSGAFGLHLIAARHIDLVWRFTLKSGREFDKLAGLECHTAVTGTPLLSDCLAWLDCRVLTHIDVGDRILIWADVVAGRKIIAETPLCEHELFAVASPETKAQLQSNLQHDIGVLAPMHDAWRKKVAGL